MTHADLVQRAEKWLRNVLHCRVVLCELVAYTSTGETPDAIGWVGGRCILVECKASRSDFRADQAKRSRHQGQPALGDWRFYLTPPGLLDGIFLPPGPLKALFLPPGWGWYEVGGRQVRHVAGESYHNAGPTPHTSDLVSEVALLTSALARTQATAEE